NEEEFIALERAFQASGVYGRAPDGLTLESDLFYWVAVSCRQGRVHFNAWQYPSDRFASLEFQDELLQLDETGIAYNKPRHIDPLYREKRQQRNYRAGNISGPYFELIVRGGEIGGVTRLF
ncbi:MAG: hypothetical protein R3212_06195, partial [Xanthomonadales bacterium]|nr:hypothetical protein [Xanthomonadales bacterium]